MLSRRPGSAGWEMPPPAAARWTGLVAVGGREMGDLPCVQKVGRQDR